MTAPSVDPGERFGDLVDRFSFYAPYKVSADQWRALLAGFPRD